ncbi:hypothetical protein B0H11DRAFT_1912238 [Mycena galericulata]|nr:hypothetical protein B0H11DRAFT_1912238 [Mycena galericulata]
MDFGHDPTYGLCAELLSMALKFAIGPFSADPHGYAGRRRLIRGVCRYWRNVVDGDCTVWCQIYVNNFTHMEEVSQALSMSKQRLLTLHLVVYNLHSASSAVRDDQTDYAIRFIAAVSASFHRCRTLILSVSGVENTLCFLPLLSALSAPALEFLELAVEPEPLHVQETGQTIAPIFQSDLPLLQSLTFKSTFIYWMDAPYYSNLRHLHLDTFWKEFNLSADQFYDLFREPPTLPHLTRMELGVSEEAECILVSTLNMPALRALHVLVEGEGCLSAFLRHCSALLSQIRTMALDAVVASRCDFEAVLEALPEVRRLDLRGCVLSPSSSMRHTEGCIVADTGTESFGVVRGQSQWCPRLTEMLFGADDTLEELIYQVLNVAVGELFI